MNTFIWVCQIFLAITFRYSGIMKFTQSRERLVSMGQTGVTHLSYPTIRFIGLSEILGVAGIIVPWAYKIMPVLTPVTAVCFALIMLLAIPLHYKRREFLSVSLNVFIFCVSLFVAYMRFS